MRKTKTRVESVSELILMLSFFFFWGGGGGVGWVKVGVLFHLFGKAGNNVCFFNALTWQNKRISNPMLASSTLQEILLSRKIRILVYTTLLLLLLYLKCQV